MFGTENLGVNKLHRESIGGLKLPEDLKEGECIEMTKENLESLILLKLVHRLGIFNKRH